MTTTKLLRKAATIIRENAKSLRECHCVPPDFALCTMEPEMREVYDDEMKTARELDAASTSMLSAMDQLVEAAGYALGVLDHNRGKQARGRACDRLRAAIAQVTEYPPASPVGGPMGAEQPAAAGLDGAKV